MRAMGKRSERNRNKLLDITGKWAPAWRKWLCQSQGGVNAVTSGQHSSLAS